LPAKLGFTVPPVDVIRISDGLHALPPTAQSMWSGWLIGCVVAYGLIPRLIGLAVCILRGRKTLATLGPDAGLPGYAELRERLSPRSEKTGIDAPDHVDFQAHLPVRPSVRHQR